MQLFRQTITPKKLNINQIWKVYRKCDEVGNKSEQGISIILTTFYDKRSLEHADIFTKRSMFDKSNTHYLYFLSVIKRIFING